MPFTYRITLYTIVTVIWSNTRLQCVVQSPSMQPYPLLGPTDVIPRVPCSNATSFGVDIRLHFTHLSYSLCVMPSKLWLQ